jgi:hypothetical protein
MLRITPFGARGVGDMGQVEIGVNTRLARDTLSRCERVERPAAAQVFAMPRPLNADITTACTLLSTRRGTN